MTQRKSTGFKELDKLTGGLADGALVVIGSRPGMGKTALALEIARRMAEKPETTIVIFSYEMSAQHINLRMGGAKPSIRVYDDPNTTVEDMLKLCKNTEKLGAVVIDYFQLISDPASPSQADRSGNAVAHSLKEMAQELNVPVICTSQLSRDCCTRKNPHPIFGDLPAQLQEEGDQLLLLYQNWFCKPHAPVVIKCSVVKNDFGDGRIVYGDIGTARLLWYPKQGVFYETGELIPL